MANVFISHAGEDSPLAAELRDWLITGGHSVFLDRDLRDGIGVGEEWEQRLHERLRWADATVCVVTTAYVSSAWCMAEVAIARSRGSRLLPVCAEAGVVHPLLKSVQFADLVGNPAAAREALSEAVRRVDRLGGLGWADDRSPFPGLRPFDAELHRAFFGRNEDIETLTGLLRSPAERANNTVLLVVGPSGCGKSSLVRAGLLPRMADEPDWWTLPAFTPGVDPRAALVRELAAMAREIGDGRTVGEISSELDRGGIVAVVDELLLAAPGRRRKRLLVVVDQFEELLTQTSAESRAGFAALLRTALTGPVDVVATLRPEFLDQLLVDHDLATLPVHPHMVRPLRRETLRTVIEGPARLAGLRVSDELVARLVADTDSGEALPLLAFTLSQLAEGIDRGGELSWGRYESLGGVQGALIRQADAALAEAMAATGRGRDEVIASLLLVVTIDEQNRPTRLHVRRDSLPAPVPAELDAFVAHRLLTIDTVNGEAVIGASHEKFFTAWPPLDEAIKATASALRARRSIEEAAAGWAATGRIPDALWERGQLSAAVAATGARVRARTVTATRVDISPVGREFLYASVRRNRSRRQRVVLALSVLLVVAMVAGVIALVQERNATDRQRQAQEQALIATARQLVAKAEAALGTDPRTALMLSVAAHRIHPDAETYASLQKGLTTTPFSGQLVGVNSQVSSIAYSASGRYLAAGFDSGAIMLWDLRDPLRPRQVGEPFIGFEFGVIAAFSANDTRLVTASSSGAVTIWDLTDPEHPRQLGNPVAGVKYRDGGAWLSPDGTVLATSNKDSPALQLWDVTDPAQLRPLGPPIAMYPTRVEAVAFSADGGTIAAASGAGHSPVTLWDIRQRAEPRPLGRIVLNPDDLVGSLSFSADDKTLAVGGQFRGTALWNVSDPANPRPARDLIRVSIGTKVRFSPNGATLAITSGSRDTGVLLWNVSNQDFPSRTETLIAGQDDLTMAFSPDGRTVASGSKDGRVTLWNLARAGRPRAFGTPFVGHKVQYKEEIYALAMSEDGTMIATGGRDTTVALWDVADPSRPRQLATLTGHTGEGVDAVSFSPDGTILATGDGEENVILWDLTDREHPRRLEPSLKGPTNIIRSLVFSADGRTLIVGGDQRTIFWDVRERSQPRRLEQVLDKEGVLGIWRIRDGRVLALVRGSGTTTTSTAVAAPTVPTSGGVGEAKAAPQQGGPGDRTGTRLWDITDPAHPRQLGPGLVGHEHEVRSAAMSPAGDLLVTGDDKGAAILWDIKDPVRARRLGDTLVPHGSLSAINMVFAPSTDIMVTAGIFGDAYLWDLGNQILPRQLGTALSDNLDAIYHMVFSSNGDILAMAGSRGDVVLWDLRPTYELRGHLDETACLVTGGGLNRDQWARYLSAVDYQDTCRR